MNKGTALALAAGLSLGLMGAAAPAPLMRVTIKPSAMSEAVGKGQVDITLAIPALTLDAGAPLLSRGGRGLGDLTLTDAKGPVPLVPPAKAGGGDSDGPGPGPGRRGGAGNAQSQWTVGRAVSGAAVLHYTVTTDTTTTGTGGVPTVPHIDGDGFSAAGNSLISTPALKGDYRVAIDWDLAAMGPGAAGISTYGDGNVVLPAGPLARLSSSMFMAGHVKREPQTGAFQAVWLGEPQFDVRGAMDWTAKLHGWMSKFFKDRAEPPYRVFLRSNPNNPGGGVALGPSFTVGYGPPTTAEGLKTILGHEMTHTWTASDDIGRWYNEGDAVYYQARNAWRAGMIPIEKYLGDINATAARYYTNPKKDADDSLIDPNFFRDQWLNVLAYDRGAIYFAILDGKIKRKSGGKRSVDDLVNAMVERARQGKTVNEAAWTTLLSQEVGPDAVTLHKAMMTGKGVLVPESGDYGPCFRRVDAKIRAYDMGFSQAQTPAGAPAGGPPTGGPPRAAGGGGRLIASVEPGSEAEKAGLRAGDRVTYEDSSEGTRRNVTETLTLHVTRDEKTFDITYLPRGAPIDGYQWERVPGVAESACK